MRAIHPALGLALALLLPAGAVRAEEFSFDLEALEKRPLQWDAYVELRYEGSELNRDAALYLPQYPDEQEYEQRLITTVELNADYSKGDNRLSATWHGSNLNDSRNHLSEGRLYEAYWHREESAGLGWALGKQAFKWGKGYAWNPVGFTERPKDPSDPEQGREGYLALSADWVSSGHGALQTVGFTPVVLPVAEEINEDFGVEKANNLAAKLYMLYHDIDIELLVLGNGSRPGRVGMDFSLNLAGHIELHGEWAFIADYPQRLLDGNGPSREHEDSHIYLLGMRYLTEGDTTWIVEYLHQDHGYTPEQMADFYQQMEQSNDPQSLQEAGQQAGYLRANPMQDYLYVRAVKKEPFDWLYSSLAFSAIVNLADDSAMLMPEYSYTGMENMVLTLRLARLDGEQGTEFGEKLNRHRLDTRLRYFF